MTTTADSRPHNNLGVLGRLVGVVAFEITAIVLLHWAGQYQFLQVPFDDIERWLSDTAAEDVLAASIRLTGLVLAYWLLASTVLYGIGLLAGQPQILRSVSWVMIPGARRVLDGMLAISITGTSLTTALPAGASTAQVTVQPDQPQQTNAPTPADGVASKLAIYPQSTPLPPPPANSTTHQVADGESLLDIATQHFGDPNRWTDIWQANADRLNAAGIAADARPKVGWTLVIPNHAQQTPAATDPPPAETATVQAGDSLWTISEDKLTADLQRHPSPDETTPYWQNTIATNQHHLASGDPDVIYPGEHITLPPTDTEISASAPATPDSHDQATTPAPAPTTAAPDEQPTTTSQTPSTAPQADSPTTPNPRSNDHADDQHDDSNADDSVPVRPIGTVALLGGMILAGLARRRRARRRLIRPDTPPQPRPAGHADQELAISQTSGHVLERAELVSRALGQVFQSLRHDTPTVTGLIVKPDGDVLVHLREPTSPPAPFLTGPDGTWLLPGATQLERTAKPALWTLVTLGQVDQDWVLVDLESLGAVEITGPDEQATQLLRSMVAELALQPLAHILTVEVAGIELPDEPIQGRRHLDELDEETARGAEQAAARVAAELEDLDCDVTTAARVQGVPRDGLIPTVIATTANADPVLAHRISQSSLPGNRGICIVSLAPLGADATQLTVDTDQRLAIPHLGLTARQASLNTNDLQKVNRLVEQEPETPEPDESRADNQASHSPPPLTAHTTPRDWRPAPSNGDSDPEMDWDLVVRVFANHIVETRDGETISFKYGDNPIVPHKNTNRGAELISYLALTEGRASTFDRIRSDLWPKQIAEGTVDKLISGTRSVLRTVSGGQDLITPVLGDPRRRYKLDRSVVTDVELLTHALNQAQTHFQAHQDHRFAFDILRPHLARIEAPAFNGDARGRGLSHWAGTNRIVDKVEHPLIAAALYAAQLLTDHGAQPDLSDALWAIDQALLACPINEALIRAAMELDDRLGHRNRANRRYQAVTQELCDDEIEPEDRTTELRHRIMSSEYRIG